MSSSGYVHLEVEEITGETEMAFFLKVDGQEVCVPKSQIADAKDYSVGDENCTVSVTEWIARQKGLL
jgi:hypothetical protein